MRKTRSLANRLWLRYGYSVPMVFQPKAAMLLKFGAVGLNEWEASICDAGHFVMEENPQAVLAAFESFFVP